MTSRIKLSSALLIGVLLAAVVLAVPAVTAQFLQEEPGAESQLAKVAITPHEVFDSSWLSVDTGTRAVEQIEYNLTRSPEPIDKDPAWRDQGAGDKIMFASNRDSASDGAGVQDNYDLWTMNVDGSGKVKIYASDTTDEIEPSWSPSGTRIAFARKAKALPDSAYQIYYYDTTTSALVQITYAADFPNGARHPAWRPDGAGIILQADTGAGTGTDLWMINLDGSGIVQIEGGPGEETDPKLFAGSLVFTSTSVDSGGTPGLLDASDTTQSDKDCWIARWLGYAAENAQPIASGAGDQQQPEIVTKTVDNSKLLLVYASNESGDFDLYKLTADYVGGTWAPGPATALLPPASVQIPNGRPNGFDDVDPSAGPIAAVPAGYSVLEAWANPKTSFTSTRDYTTNPIPGMDPLTDDGTNIWLISIFDINPPILTSLPLTIDPATGLERKAFAPGQQVIIRATVQDQETGVNQVFAVFHDADDPQWGYKFQNNHDPDGCLIWDDDPYAGLMEWRERNYRVIDRNGNRQDVLRAPWEVLSWGLQLFDDGAHDDGAADDGVYGNRWTTPNLEVDYYVDIVPIDNANNLIISGLSSWDIGYDPDTDDPYAVSFGYDNVTGFTTKPFVGGSRVLYVSDYACGQKFIATINERYTGIIGNRYYVVGIPCDHYLLQCPLPTYYPDPDASDPRWPSWMGEDSPLFGPPSGGMGGVGTWHDKVCFDPGPVYVGQQQFDNGTDFPLRIGYTNLSYNLFDTVDIWRVICRGPITQDVLTNFVPRTTTDPVTGQTRFVADKLVVWLSPYTGDLWTGAGTIRDLAVQGRLQTFMDQGGRLLLSGQDVAWALTLNGAAPSSFLSNYFGVTFASDGAYDNWTARHQLTGTNEQLAANRIGDKSGGLGFWWNIPDDLYDTYWPLDHLQMIGGYDIYRGDAAENQGWVDSVNLAANAAVAYSFDGGGQGAIAYRDSLGNRRVFLSFGLEAIRRNYTVGDVSAGDETFRHILCLANRARFLKNFSAYVRTGTAIGTVVFKEGLAPVEGAVVTLTGPGGAYNAVTGADGTYTIEGIEPGSYSVTAVKAGYTIDHLSSVTVEDASIMRAPFTQLTEAPNGAISGHVEDDQGNPVFGAHVIATEDTVVGTPITGDAYTDVNGNYVIPDLPTADYNCRCEATGYSPQDYEANPVTVNPGQTTTGIDFVLAGEPGHMYGMVSGSDTGGVGIPGARVRLEDGAGNIIKDIDGTDLDTTTLADGRYAFWFDDDSIPTYLDKVPAGTYTAIASAIGYSSESTIIVISPGMGTVQDFVLDKLPPGNLRGLVTDEATGAPLGGITVELQPVGGGAALYSTVTNTSAGYNYEFTDVESGDYWVVPVPGGALTPDPTYREATVAPGLTTSGINFVMKPPYAWSSGLFLMSLPGTFAPDTPAAVLGLNNITIGNLAYWNRASLDYDYVFPTGEITSVLPGRGYWLLSEAGVSVQAVPTEIMTDPYVVPLSEGWNMIGMPFANPVSWYDLVISYSGGSTKPIMQAAADGDIGSALWMQKDTTPTYELASGMAAWKGYWLLVKNTNVVGLSVPKRSVRSLTAELPGGLPFETVWNFELETSVNGMPGGSAIVGAAQDATASLDNLYDIVKPAPLTSVQYVDLSLGAAARAGEGLGVDIRAADTVREVYDLTVQTNVPGGQVALTWNDLSALPREYKVVLVDPDTGKTVFMRTASSYNFLVASRAGDQTKHLQVIVTKEAIGALAVTGLAADATTKGTGTVRYTLSQEAYVTTAIYNLGGTLVKTLEQDMLHATGTVEVPWDGTDNGGRELPNGSYLVKVTASSESGETLTVFRTMVVLR